MEKEMVKEPLAWDAVKAQAVAIIKAKNTDIHDVSLFKPFFGEGHTTADIVHIVSGVMADIASIPENGAQYVQFNQLLEVWYVDTDKHAYGGPCCESEWAVAINELHDTVRDIYLLRITYGSESCPIYIEHHWQQEVTV